MSRKNSPGHLIHEFVVRIGSVGEAKALTLIHEAGLTMPQVIALSLLHHEGPQAISTLSQRLGLSLSATSAMVQRLVELGMVARTEDPGDRRQKQVTLTTDGFAFVDKVTAERTAAIARGVGTLPPELRKQFLDVLALVVEHLRGEMA